MPGSPLAAAVEVAAVVAVERLLEPAAVEVAAAEAGVERLPEPAVAEEAVAAVEPVFVRPVEA